MMLASAFLLVGALRCKQALFWLCLLSRSASALEQPICRVHVAYWGWSAQEDKNLGGENPGEDACKRNLNKLLKEDLLVVSFLLAEVGCDNYVH